MIGAGQERSRSGLHRSDIEAERDPDSLAWAVEPDEYNAFRGIESDEIWHELHQIAGIADTQG
jgi:hypothetical protein